MTIWNYFCFYVIKVCVCEKKAVILRRFLSARVRVRMYAGVRAKKITSRIKIQNNKETKVQTNIAFICKNPIVNTLRSQLNWSQYRMLIQIPDHDKREYQLYLPTEEQLINEIDEVKSNFNHDK